jgi:glycosyltransferase involved in cell wall biosynthesis
MSLLLLGDGPNAQHVDHLAHALLGPERFLHLPKVPYDDIPAYYRAADVFTLPSIPGEAFGIVILEAMAAGLPVVVSDDPVRRWIAGDRGWFVDAQDTASYAEALLGAAKMGTGTVDPSYLARFDWATVAREYEQFFEQIRGCGRGQLRDGMGPRYQSKFV